eukprot:jgi/Tetstr1/422589/TSEL_013396.t1
MSVSAAPRSPPKIAAPVGSAPPRPRPRTTTRAKPLASSFSRPPANSNPTSKHRPRTTIIAKPLASSFYSADEPLCPATGVIESVDINVPTPHQSSGAAPDDNMLSTDL